MSQETGNKDNPNLRNLTTQELFNKFAADLSPLSKLANIGNVVYKLDPFLKGTQEVKDFLEALTIKWWIHNTAELQLLMDLQVVSHLAPELQAAQLEWLAFEYALNYGGKEWKA